MKTFGKPHKINGEETQQMFCPQEGISWDEKIGGPSNTIYFLKEVFSKKVIAHTCSPEIAGYACAIETPNENGITSVKRMNPSKCPYREDFIRNFVQNGMEVGELINLKKIINIKKTIKVSGKNKEGENVLYSINPRNFKNSGHQVAGEIIVKDDKFLDKRFDNLFDFYKWANEHFDDIESVQSLVKVKAK